jgi:hypothetical protein
MTLLRRLSLIVPIAALLLAGCGGGDDDTDSNSTGSIPSSGTPATTGGAGPTAGFTREQLAELSMTEVEGYVRQEPPLMTAANLGILYEPAEGRSGLSAVVKIAPCTPVACWDLEGEIGDDEEANLKSSLPQSHLDNSDLVFEYGTIEVASGYTAFFTYSRSFVSDGGSTATVNAYRLQYHDGSNAITIHVTPARLTSLPDSADELEMQMDQSKGEMAARNIFAAFAAAFTPS